MFDFISGLTVGAGGILLLMAFAYYYGKRSVSD